ncbi:putative PadR family transcriptional regulator [Gordonia effusa NBRC 100432]|uniref:Putative PadR family transcriptional regulator n=1 Tax=Gordonia effusa NBRC 100432 TaxID=1077974 RepID=H0QVS6_9ACTN|nr:helix-turn-helix transcriptional regulator [Gordonia effusa]GAB16927.1 putative PadR family transcriptional regulator [Gordonia effusa NBRC 100432]
MAQDGKPLPPLAVLVLGLVIERPMHPYEMVQTAMARHEDRLANIRPGSLYHAVSRLEGQGHVRIHDVEREGNRPERTVYAITPAGRRAYLQAVTMMLGSHRPEFPQLFMALALAHDLPRAEVIELLDERLAAMNEELETLAARAAEASAANVPEMFFLDGGCRLATLRTQIDWLSTLVKRLRDKTIDWLDDPGFVHRLRVKQETGKFECAPSDDH